MIKFDNIKDLEKYLKGVSTSILKNEIVEVAKRVIEKYIYENVYQYQPKEYTRTYELWDSLTVSDVFTDDRGRTSIKIYFDTNKIKPHMVTDNWNQHADIYDNDTSKYIPLWVEEGAEGSLWDRQPANIFGNSVKELERTKKHIYALIKELKANGIDVKRI